MTLADFAGFIQAADELRKLNSPEGKPTPDKVFDACVKYDTARESLINKLKALTEN